MHDDVLQGGDEIAHQVAFQFDLKRTGLVEVLPISHDPLGQHHHCEEEGGDEDEVHQQGGEELGVSNGPLGDGQVAGDLQGRQEQQHREGDERQEVLGVPHHLSQDGRGGVILDA